MASVASPNLGDATIKQRLKAVSAKTENQFCCDCGDLKPAWASIVVPPPGVVGDEKSKPMGAFCCFHCSGAHRKLGVHVCFVRSITLDDWKGKEVEAMEMGGNLRVNEAFEAKLHQSATKIEKPNSKSDLDVRDKFVKAKYGERRFLDATKYESGSIYNASLPEQAFNIPELDPNIFVGMSTEDMFSASKADLFEAPPAKLRESPSKPTSLSAIVNMEALDVTGRLSQDDYLHASKEDTVNMLLGLPDRKSRASDAATEEKVSSIGKHVNENSSGDVYHIALRDDQSQSTALSATSSKNSTSKHPIFSRSRRSRASKSPAPEGRTPSRPKVRRSDSAHDPLLPPEKPVEYREKYPESHRRSRESSRRSSSRSRRGHARKSSASMRRSESGQSLDAEELLQLRMRRSSSGHDLEERKAKRSGMRRTGSTPGLEAQPATRSSVSRRTGSSSSIHRNASEDSLSALSSHSTDRNRRHRDPLGGSLHRKGRSIGNVNQMRNKTFDVKMNENTVSIKRQSCGASMLSERRFVVPSKFALGECEATVQETPPRKRSEKDPLGSRSSHDHRSRNRRKVDSKSPVRIPSRQSSSEHDDQTRMYFHRTGSRSNSLDPSDHGNSSSRHPSPRKISLEANNHTTHRRVARRHSGHHLETDGASKGRSTHPPSRQGSLEECGDNQKSLSPGRSLSRSDAAHDSERVSGSGGKFRRSASREDSDRDLDIGKKSVNPSITMSLPPHVTKLLDRSGHSPRNLKARAGFSRNASDGDRSQLQGGQGGVGTTSPTSPEKDDRADDKHRPSATMASRSRAVRRRHDPLASKSEYRSIGRSCAIQNSNHSQTPSAGAVSRHGHFHRTGSLSDMGERNNSLGSASAHGTNPRCRHRTAHVVPANPDRFLKLFATTTPADTSESKVKDDWDMDGRLNSPDGSLPVHTGPMSKAARKAMEDLKGILQ